jgi:UDP-N-acetylglucosamine--N-acetylmuramyl-(pentapeptide) pyrophosphoryl-undecaprenol N-acetylglucosamine transferase
VRDAYAGLDGVTCRVEPFIENMGDAYAWADLVICRAGALTVAELAVTGRPSILVPLPHAIDDHQTANARFLADAGAACLIPQAELPATLQETLETLLAEPARLASMARAALACARPRATQDLADCAMELMS